MDIKKITCCASIVVMVSAMSLTGQAADKPKDASAEEHKEKAPIVIEADYLSFGEVTGDLFADGNVILTKNTESILTDHLRGNTTKSQVWIDGKAILKEPGAEFSGVNTQYNYKSRIGDMHKAVGTVDKNYIYGDHLEFLPGKWVAHDGTVTGCPAIVPDYHISAEKVEIWPGEKMIAYNAKFWLGKTMIFSLGKYQTSLTKSETESVFPRVEYSSSQGFKIAQYLEYPLGDKVAIFTDLAYYSKAGLRPTYGLVSRNSNFTMKLSQGKEQNDDNEWIMKEPEFMFKIKPKRFGSVVADFTVTTGKWTEGAISGGREDYKIYFKRDTVNLSSKITLDVGAGWERNDYSYDNSTNTIWSLNATVTAHPNDRLETWVGYYHNKQSGKSPYIYDQIDVERQVSTGFMYKVDKKNGLGIKMDYDLAQGEVKDLDYTWRHNLHCWDADITYRAKRDEWNMKISTGRW